MIKKFFKLGCLFFIVIAILQIILVVIYSDEPKNEGDSTVVIEQKSSKDVQTDKNTKSNSRVERSKQIALEDEIISSLSESQKRSLFNLLVNAQNRAISETEKVINNNSSLNEIDSIEKEFLTKLEIGVYQTQNWWNIINKEYSIASKIKNDIALFDYTLTPVRQVGLKYQKRAEQKLILKLKCNNEVELKKVMKKKWSENGKSYNEYTLFIYQPNTDVNSGASYMGEFDKNGNMKFQKLNYGIIKLN